MDKAILRESGDMSILRERGTWLYSLKRRTAIFRERGDRAVLNERDDVGIVWKGGTWLY